MCGGSRTVLDRELVARLLGRKRVLDLLAALTERERGALDLMAQGCFNLAQSAKLFLSPKTFESHVRSIKLNLPQDAAGHRRFRAVLAYLRAR
ncbi:LuxR C-terminal-related transcriptional regulator [Streptomyces sp. NPDC055722]